MGDHFQDGTLKIEQAVAKRDLAIFLTPAFHPAQQSIGVIFYYHGFHRSKGLDLAGFLKASTTAKLLQSLKSAPPLALVMPDLGADSSQGGDWASPKLTFEALMEQVRLFAAKRARELLVQLQPMDEFESAIHRVREEKARASLLDPRLRGPVQPMPLGNLVLAAHSGGGGALKRTLMQEKSGLLASLKEVWMLDCFYGDLYGRAEDWKAWGNSKGAIPKRIVRAPKSILDPSIIKGMSGLKFLVDDGDHENLPGKYFPKFIDACACFQAQFPGNVCLTPQARRNQLPRAYVSQGSKI